MSETLDSHGKPAPPAREEVVILCPHCEATPFNLRMASFPTGMNGNDTILAVMYCGSCKRAINGQLVSAQTLDVSHLAAGGRQS